MRRHRPLVVLAAAFLTAVAVPAIAVPVSPSALVPDLPAADDAWCDPIDPAHCLLPFPNDFFTVDDASTDTGRRVALNPLAMPRNSAGKPIDPTEWNRNDGFSPGSMVLTYVPGLDLHATWGEDADHITDPEWSMAADAPIFILDATTGKRHPFWSELDTHPQTTDDRRLLILRPAVNFEEGHRYIVAMRNLRDAGGTEIEANASFAAYRDGGDPPVPSPLFDSRRPAMERVFDDLGANEHSAHYERADLYLAWDFTVASARNLAGRVLHMRDDAFGRLLGDTDLSDGRFDGDAPAFTIERVTEFAPGTGATARRVEGTVTVPNYLRYEAKVDDGDGYSAVAAPGSRLFYASPVDELPSQNPALPTIDVDFVCNVPSAASAGDPAHPMLYGHGLLGARQEANGGSTEDMRIRNFMPCAVDWMGMSFSDLANVVTILGDMSNFPSLADRAQQGFLNFLYLGRAVAHPTQGFATRPEFADAQGRSLIRGGELHYDGNSQGGIMGGALTALAPDFTTSVLGVPGMNYSTLLNRSKDWEGEYDPAAAAQEAVGEQDPEAIVPPYSYPAYQAYPDKLEQQLMFALIQMLWDRAEANGFAHHMTDDPYPNTPGHRVMLQVAFSDHQVANVSAEVEGRTIGAAMHGGPDPVTGEWAPVPFGLHWSDAPDFGFDRATFGVPGSYLVYWHSTDRGLTTPPNGNIPPSVGVDPHEAPRRNNRGSDQKRHFLLTSQLLDVCGGPCVTDAAAEKN